MRDSYEVELPVPGLLGLRITGDADDRGLSAVMVDATGHANAKPIPVFARASRGPDPIVSIAAASGWSVMRSSDRGLAVATGAWQRLVI